MSVRPLAFGKTLPLDPGSAVAVMPLKANRVPDSYTRALDDFLLRSLRKTDQFESVIGTREINALLDLERMKDALGGDDVVCATEIGGGLGVDYLLIG